MDCIKALAELAPEPGDYQEFARRALGVVRSHGYLSGACLFDLLPGGALAEPIVVGGLLSEEVTKLAHACIQPALPGLQYGKPGTPLQTVDKKNLLATPVGIGDDLCAVLVLANGGDQAVKGIIAALCRILSSAKQSQRLLMRMTLQQGMLDGLASGQTQADLLNELARGVEAEIRGSICSIMRYRDEQLQLAAAPSAAAKVARALREFVAQDGAGSCASAALTGEPQLVSDTLADPRWRGVRDLASSCDIHACWSMPAKRGRDGAVLGTLAISNARVAYPDANQLSLLKLATRWAAHILAVCSTRTQLEESRLAYRSMIDDAAEAITVFDMDANRFVEWNRRALDLFGVDEATVVNIGVSDISPALQPDGRRSEEAAAAYLARVAEGQVVRFEWMHRASSGRLFPCEIYLTPMLISEKRWVRAAIFDISARRAEEETRRRLEFIVESTSDMVATADAQHKIVYMNSAGKHLLGLGPDETPLGRAISDFHDTRFMQMFQQAMWPYVLEHGVWRGEVMMKSAEGVEIPTSAVLIAHRGVDGNLEFLSLVARDVSVSRANEQALQLERRRFQALFDDNPLTLLMVNEKGRILEANRFGLEQLRYDRDLVTRAPLSGLVAPSRAPALERQLAACFAEAEEVHRWEEEFVNLSGKVLWMRVTARVIPGDGEPRLLLACEDFSEAHRLSEELSYQATHDPLTELPNRRAFERQLRSLLVEAQSVSVEHALCYLDLDNFKRINDSCGHLAGDELLRQLARRLRKKVRSADLLARLGGDEFGVLLRDCPSYQTATIAESIRAAVEAFRFSWNGRSFSIGVSIGIVHLTDGTLSLEAALREADAACYAAKQAGRNRVCVHQATDTAMQLESDEMMLLSQVQEALESDRFELFWQAMEAMSERSTARRVEVLLRMRGSNNTLILPARILPAAERFSLSSQIDQWVLKHLLEWLGEHRKVMDSLDRCSMNIAAQTIADPTFIDALRAGLKKHGIAAKKLCFELTESSALARFSDTLHFTEQLHALGCAVCLDDFGNGFSSFAYLQQLSPEVVKIDGALVRNIAPGNMEFAVVDSIVRVSKTLGVKTVAKCVESVAILDQLGPLDIDFVQGYHLHKPQALPALESPG